MPFLFLRVSCYRFSRLFGTASRISLPYTSRSMSAISTSTYTSTSTSTSTSPSTSTAPSGSGSGSSLSLPSSYLALYLSRFVSSPSSFPTALSLISRPFSNLSLSPSDVLIRIHYASINPSDVKNALGSMTSTVLPRVLGRDFCGQVCATGSNIEAKAMLNTLVYGTGGDLGFERDGSHAEYMILPVTAVTRIPQSLSPIQASSVGVNYCTALHGLQRGGITHDDIVLVTGANGGVGSAVVQLAKRMGATVIAVLRSKPTITSSSSSSSSSPSPSPSPYVADASIYLSDIGGFAGLSKAVSEHPLVQQKFAGEPNDAHHRRGATLAFDVLGGDVLPHILSSLSTRGRCVFISMPLPHEPIPLNGFECYRQELSLIGVNSLLLSCQECATALQSITEGFDSGELAPRDATSTIICDPKQNIGQAYSDVINGKAKGKVVLKFIDT